MFKKILLGAFGAALLVAACIGTAPAAADDDMLDVGDLQALPESTLRDLRGGFSIGGFNIAFGVTIQAAIDGATILKTSFNVLQSNVLSDPTVTFLHDGAVVYSNGGQGQGGTGIPIATQNLAQGSGGTGGTGTVTSITNGQVLAHANGFMLVQLDGGGYGIASPTTSVIQSVGQNGIVSEIANSENNRLIQTTMSLNVFFTNFAEMAGRTDMNRMMTNLFSETANPAALGN